MLIQPFLTPFETEQAFQIKKMLATIAKSLHADAYCLIALLDTGLEVKYNHNINTTAITHSNFVTSTTLLPNEWLNVELNLVEGYNVARMIELARENNQKIVFMVLYKTIEQLPTEAETFTSELLEHLKFMFTNLTNNYNQSKIIRKGFSVTSHDVRGPLGSITQILNLYKTGAIDQTEFLQFLPKLSSQIIDTQAVLSHLLNWADGMRKDLGATRKKTSPNQLIQTILQTYNNQANQKEIVLTNGIIEALENLSFDKDGVQIILNNLVQNAIKFCTKGCIVELGFSMGEKHISFFVKDDGPGFDEEIKSQILTEGVFPSKYGTAQEKGYGLGLQICNLIIQKNEGQLLIDSKPGKTTITILLPI